MLGHLLVRRSGPLAELTSARATVTLVVVVTSDPVAWSAADRDTRRVSAHAQVVQVSGRGRSGAGHAPVLLVGDDRLLPLRWHQEVALSARLAPADPGSADLALARVTGSPVVRAPPGAVARGAERLRSGLRASVSGTPPDAQGLLPGLVIGDTSRTPPDLTDAMLSTGMTHLSAVSGANVAVVLGLVLAVASVLGLPRWLRPVLALAALAGFVVLARPEPSVVRAAVMGAIALIGRTRSRTALGLPVLGAAVVLLLCYDPWLSRSYGFALSTLATLGLLVFTRPWGQAIGRRPARAAEPLGPALAVPGGCPGRLCAGHRAAPGVGESRRRRSRTSSRLRSCRRPRSPGVLAAPLSLGLAAPRPGWWRGRSRAHPRHRPGGPGVRRRAGGTMPWPDGAPGALLPRRW